MSDRVKKFTATDSDGDTLTIRANFSESGESVSGLAAIDVEGQRFVVSLSPKDLTRLGEFFDALAEVDQLNAELNGAQARLARLSQGAAIQLQSSIWDEEA